MFISDSDLPYLPYICLFITGSTEEILIVRTEYRLHIKRCVSMTSVCTH